MFLRITVGALAALVATVSLVGFLDGRFWIAELASSMRAYLLLAAPVLGVLALLVRSLTGAVLAVVALAVNAIVLVPLYTDDPVAPAGGSRLLIAHVNMQHHYEDFVEIRRVLVERRPDVLVVLEPSRGWLGRRAPVGYSAHVRGSRPEPRVLVLAGERVSNVEFPEDPKLPSSSVTFDVEFDEEPVHVLALHTAAPVTPGARRSRDDELAAASRWARRQTNPRVVLGDLNSTPWSSPLEDLEEATDLRNSAYGFGVQATWPANAGAFGIPIDQLLHSRDLTVTDRTTGPTFGSEHRSLWVTIARSDPT